MNLNGVVTRLAEKLQAQNLMVATAESCTGGWIAQALTTVPGSSNWFDRGFVTYSNQAKQEMLSVPEQTLGQFGAVSQQTAALMAAGAVLHSNASVSVATTGVAGPDGGSKEKPVGLVWFGFKLPDRDVITKRYYFSGDREAVRHHAVYFALTTLNELLCID